jgi:phage/plasmid-like protein (TIGR03299 family)
LGVVLKRHPRSLEDALRKSGLGWTVRQEPLYRRDNTQVDDWKANIRSDTQDVLGVVTNRYTVIQNKEAFGFLANLLGSELAFETAGSLHGGKRVFVTCRLASIDHVEVGGDQVDLYVNFFNRHDGAGAVQLLTTPIRTVCRNTWDTAVGSAVNTFSIRHVGSPSTRIAEARTALDLSIDYTKQFKRFGDRLAKQKIAERKVLQIASELWPDNGTDRQIRNAQARREAVLRLFSEGATIGNAPGTKWCAANALLEQLEWGSGTRSPEGRFLRHISDQGGLKARALELVLDA